MPKRCRLAQFAPSYPDRNRLSGLFLLDSAFAFQIDLRFWADRLQRLQLGDLRLFVALAQSYCFLASWLAKIKLVSGGNFTPCIAKNKVRSTCKGLRLVCFPLAPTVGRFGDRSPLARWIESW